MRLSNIWTIVASIELYPFINSLIILTLFQILTSCSGEIRFCPDVNSVVDWVLKIKYLSSYLDLISRSQVHHKGKLTKCILSVVFLCCPFQFSIWLFVQMYKRNERAFDHDVTRFMVRNGLKMCHSPIWQNQRVGLFQLFLAVHERGGYVQVLTVFLSSKS